MSKPTLDNEQFKNTIQSIKLIVFDFDGVFTDNRVHVQENGAELVSCWRGDGIGLQKLRLINVKTCIVSTEKNKVVSARAKKLNVECYQGVDDKRECIKQICNKYDIKFSQTAFVGNDINDIPGFELVGFKIGVSDCHYDILPFIDCQTLMPGGRGAVREICDLFAKLTSAK